jgi:hypothetical protein
VIKEEEGHKTHVSEVIWQVVKMMDRKRDIPRRWKSGEWQSKQKKTSSIEPAGDITGPQWQR